MIFLFDRFFMEEQCTFPGPIKNMHFWHYRVPKIYILGHFVFQNHPEKAKKGTSGFWRVPKNI